MCRRNQLLGCCAFTFGLGLLIGHCLGATWLCNCCGIGLMGFGFVLLKQR